MSNYPENPIIQCYQETGYPTRNTESVFCPVCGEENPEELYFQRFSCFERDIVGCSSCITSRDAFEWYTDNKE